jgi:predicted RNA-binding Zn-ribbon protein involved in translation (DUF1610 family)
MTIRQTLRGWYRYLWISLLSVGAFGLAWHDNGYNHTLRIGVLVLLCAAAVTLFAFGFRCPRCGTSLIPNAAHIVMSGAPFACPKCRVSVDEKR